MYENWEKDICNIINNVGVSINNVKSKKEEIKKKFEENKDNILYEYTLKNLYFNNDYNGAYNQICGEVAKVILNYLEEEKAIMELIAENYMYPIGEVEKNSIYYNFSYKMQGAGFSTSGRSGINIKTIPYKFFRKL
ncbi:hypothetical protein [Clostridium beijerinckii]|uniref:hypothetical protein n=1 Tax=Clostridium beijerinckii TaxID=1520 RepID=UPI00047BD986|nr:hypothetical protein [Clostridium beijerinckii]